MQCHNKPNNILPLYLLSSQFLPKRCNSPTTAAGDWKKLFKVSTSPSFVRFRKSPLMGRRTLAVLSLYTDGVKSYLATRKKYKNTSELWPTLFLCYLLSSTFKSNHLRMIFPPIGSILWIMFVKWICKIGCQRMLCWLLYK